MKKMSRKASAHYSRRDVTRRAPNARDSVRMKRSRNNRLGEPASPVDSTTERGKDYY